MIPCVACGEPVDRREARCPRCGSARIVPWSIDAGGSACAVHRDRRAAASCSRCGVFACPTCLIEAGDGRLLCRTCGRERRESGLPWDDSAFGNPLGAFVRTVFVLLFRPLASFAAARPGAGAGGPLVFGAIALIPSFFSTAVLFSLMPEGALASRGLALLMATGFALWGLGLPALEYLLLRALGCEDASLHNQYRAAGYSLAPLAVGFVPLAGCSLLPLWCVVLKVLACRSLQRCDWLAAALAVSAIPLVLLGAALALRLDVLLLEL
ncbi:MAG: YIP1 family protein [Myxococcales bacterium]